ncbi:type IV pilus biogenesis/stability protein PilW [uncultured Paraglaciecola sp.]|uniref:type IV pilus biogenesis/stability protein PilW n=1 Tax=uncultured Paraglaciecola sp. TaxID=1765024 RepID=UPI0025929DB9|nr:type IV pilus biogenesis/stability protein PilW [uncultured Paraglaciecola sp.]
MIKVISVSFTILILLSGCVTQTGPGTVQKGFDRDKAAENRVSLGLTYLKNGNFSSAKFNLDKALEFAPRSADANYAMAYYYQSVGELEQAEEAYQYAMDLEPNNADIANTYGAFLCQNGKYEKAKEYFLKAVNSSSYNLSAQTYENLALCSQSQGRPEEAVQYFRSAVNHQPSRSHSLYLLTQALIDTQQWAEAQDVFKRYEKVSRVTPQSLIMAVSIENGLGNYSVAKGYSDMLIQLYPSNPLTLEFLKSKRDAVERNIQSSDTALLNKNKVVPIKQTITSYVSNDQQNNELHNKVINEPQDTLPKASSTVIPAKVESDVKEASKLTYHVVKRGENLYRISLQYNIKMQTLVEWNNLADESEIYNGMRLSLVKPVTVE